MIINLDDVREIEVCKETQNVDGREHTTVCFTVGRENGETVHVFMSGYGLDFPKQERV